MKKIVFTLLFLVGITPIVFSQTLGDFKPGKSGPSSLSKPTLGNKNVYIANFSVHYQVYNYRKTSTKGGSGFVRGVIGKTQAELAVGLDIPISTIQQITDNGYTQFVNELKAKGFNVLSGDAAKNIDFYKDYERHQGLEMSSAEAAGFLTVYPTEAVFYVKGFDKSGKKKGGVGLGGFQWKSEVERFNTISSQLDDAAIIDVNLYVLFMKGEGTNGKFAGRSRLTAKTNLMLAANEGVKSRVATNTDKSKWTNKVGLTAPGSKEVVVDCASKIHFIAGKNKIGGSPLVTYIGTLKKNLEIQGVIAEEKIKTEVEADWDNLGTSTAFGKLYSAENRSAKNAALIHTDANKYEKGVELAINTFLKHHVNEFKNKYSK